MKKIFLLLLATSITIVACNKDDEKSSNLSSPTVSFEYAVPVTVDGTSVLSLVVEGYTGSDAVTIPVTFSGNATKDTDYSVSAEAFVFGGSSPVTTIDVTPITYDSSKSLTATIEVPEGFSAGQYTSSTFSLSGTIGYCSFVSKSALMTDKVKVAVGVYDGSGSALKLQAGDEIPVVVNTEKSTATEEINFKFTDNKKAATIEQGSSEGYVTLEILGEVSEENNIIVLTLNPSAKYSIGQTQEIEINILGSTWERLDGKWVINELITDADYFYDEWWGMVEDTAGVPKFNADDYFIISTDEAKFIPGFKSDFKNYFIGESNITTSDVVFELHETLYSTIEVPLFNFDNVNRFFSESDFSEDTEALVAIRLIEDEDTGETLLDMYIVDHTSHAFMKELLEYDMYDKDKPVATSTGCYLNAIFKKEE